jgi:hypothetical protein
MIQAYNERHRMEVAQDQFSNSQSM